MAFFSDGTNALNKVCKALGITEEVTCLEIRLTVSEVPTLRVFRQITEEETAVLTDALIKTFKLAEPTEPQ